MRGVVGPVLVVSLLGLPGLGLFVFGVNRLLDLRSFLSRAEPTTGHVTSFTYVRSGEDSSIYALSVEYPRPDGAPGRLTVETGDSRYAVGQTVEVLQVRGPAARARIRGFGTTWTNPLVFTVVGLAWTGLALFFLVVALRPRAGTIGAHP